MLIRCISLPSPAGVRRTEDLAGASTVQEFWPVSIASFYRPLSLLVRATPSGFLQRFVLILTDREPGDLFSLAYVDLVHFEVVDPTLPSTWEIVRATSDVLEVGRKRFVDGLDEVHRRLIHGDAELVDQIMEETRI